MANGGRAGSNGVFPYSPKKKDMGKKDITKLASIKTPTKKVSNAKKKTGMC